MILTEYTAPLIIALCIVVPIVVLAILAFIIALVKRAKKMKLSKGVKVKFEESDFGGDLYSELFGDDNIINVEWEMSRVTVEVKDIDKVNTDLLQERGASGVLLVGNKVKCNFKENAETVAKYLKGKMEK